MVFDVTAVGGVVGRIIGCKFETNGDAVLNNIMRAFMVYIFRVILVPF